MVQFQDIQEAYTILKPVVKHTPLEYSKTFSNFIKTKFCIEREKKEKERSTEA
jgi:threonine dehydratase